MKKQNEIIRRILDEIEEGIHVIDKDGNTLIYNHAMAEMEEMDSVDVLYKPFEEVFKHLNLDESTLMQALLHGSAVKDLRQTYTLKTGKKITTVNSTFPIKDGEEVIASVEISQNVTKLEKLTEAIVELQKVPSQPEKAKEHKIRKYKFENLIGENQAFCQVIEIAKKAAYNSATVFIYGETGTGKELLAQSIHFDGERKNKPFLAQNCAALPASLLEGILFGTAKGGFTGALDRPGLFEEADGGTLLLDEISAMPYSLQGKLLRVLQEDYVRRVGGSKDIPVDVRIIATVNERPKVLMERGALRNDLYYRLNIIGLDLIPLRDRRDDVILLADYFISKHNARYNKNVTGLSEAGKIKLKSYDFPGNVRELENLIMAAVSMTDGKEDLTEAYLFMFNEENIGVERVKALDDISDIVKESGLDVYIKEKEVEIIREAMKLHENNISRAARYLKIKRQTLQHKLKKYEMI